MWKVKMTPGFKALARQARLTLGSLDTLAERLSAHPQSGDFLGHFHGFDVRQLHWSKFMVVFEVHEPSKTIRLTALVPWTPDLSEGLSFLRIVKKIIVGLLAAKKFFDDAQELADRFGIEIDFPDDRNDNDNLMRADGIPFGALFCADRNNWRKAVGSRTGGRQLICREPGIGKTLAFESLILAAKADKPALPDRHYKSRTQTRRYRAEHRSIAEETGDVARLQFNQSGQALTTNTRGDNDLATSLHAWFTPYDQWLRNCNVTTFDCVTITLDKSGQLMVVMGKPNSATVRSDGNSCATCFFVVDVDNPSAGDELGVNGRYSICSNAGIGKSLAFANWSFATRSFRETPAREGFASACQETVWESRGRTMTEDNNGPVPLLLNLLNKSLATYVRGGDRSTTSCAAYVTMSCATYATASYAAYATASYAAYATASYAAYATTSYPAYATTSYAAYATTSCASYATTSYAAYVTASRAAYGITAYDSYHYGFSALYLGVSYDVTTMFEGSYQLKINVRSSQSMTTKSANKLVVPRFPVCDLVSNYRPRAQHARQSGSAELDLYLDCDLLSFAPYSPEVWKSVESNWRQTALGGTR